MNREAAKKCRMRKKLCVDHLVTRNAFLERENQMLKVELQRLRDPGEPNLTQMPFSP